MNHRLTIAAAVAVVLASAAEFVLIHGAVWLVESTGAVLAVALAGTLSRLSPIPAAAGATLLAGVAAAPMLAAHSLYWKAGAVAIIGCCAASASGLRALRAVAGLVTYLAALLLYSNALFAGAHSFAVVVPTAGSLHHLVHLYSVGSALTKFEPPVKGSNHGIQFLTASSIGLAAIVVDFVAVRLRRPAIAGLPLLVIYLAPIATTAHVGGLGGAFTFLLAAAGYMALLSSDGRNRLRGWGRVVTVWHSSGEDERLGGADVGALTATGRRIGLAAVCVALIAPLLLPTTSLHHLFGGGGGGNSPTKVGLPDPVVQLHGLLGRSSPRPVLTYSSDAPDASNYLQVYVLNYDKALSQWDTIQPSRSTAVHRGQQLQAPPGLTSSAPEVVVTSHITLGQVTAGYAFPVFFLPVPYAPIQVSAPGEWREADGTLMIFSNEADHEGQSYTVTSGEVDPIPAELSVPQQIPSAIAKHYLGFSSPVTGQLRTIADKITQGKTTSFDKAVALERWFHSGRFTYNLHTTNIPNSPQGLLAFLTTNPQGYCQQFAFAMAVLARLLDIPSRVAIGYTAGTQQGDKKWLVTTADAHAWPELYFSGVGWVRFEPTPGGTGGQATAMQPPYVTEAISGSPQATQSPGASTGPSSNPSFTPSVAIPPGKLEPPQGAAGAGPGAGGSGSALPIGEALLAVLVLAAAAPRTIRTVSRRRHWGAGRDDASTARVAWQEFCADLEDYGLRTRASESPRAVARRVCAELDFDDQACHAATRIATVVERARYAPVPDATGAIRADVTQVRRSLARHSSRLVRWRARLMPASVLRPLGQSVRQALGLLTGWMPTSETAAS